MKEMKETKEMAQDKPLIRSITFCIAVIFLLAHTVAFADEITERIEWKKIPIKLNLKVGRERLIHFPSPIKVGLPGRLQPLLRAQSVDGTLYLLANSLFETTRVMVREIETGRIYLFDIAASKEGGQTRSVQIYSAEVESDSTAAPSGKGTHTTFPQYSYVTLTRFASQQLYSPARLLQDLPGITRIPVTRKPVNLLHGGDIEATPLVAWRAGNLYLTALKLTNQTDQPQTLDPRNIRGIWLSAAFQHNRLLPAGDEADTTAVYLISARPFKTSL